MKIAVVIPAAGIGKRMNTDKPKQFIEINNIPIIIKTIKLFENMDIVDFILIAAHRDWVSYMKNLIEKFDCKKVKEIIVGGAERQDSVDIVLRSSLIKNTDLVLIHDSVRPFVSEKLINKLIETAVDCGAAIPILPPTDSVKQIDNQGNVLKTLDRQHIGLVQTPEVFWTSIAVKSFKEAFKMKYRGTDISSLVEFAGHKVQYVRGEANNIKITSALDLELAKKYMALSLFDFPTKES